MNNAHHRQSGFTLIETMVALTLFVVIVSIAVGSFITALKTQRQVASLISAESNVSLALEQITREARTGYLFCHAPNVNTPAPECGCTVTGNVWSCNNLQFFNSASQQVEYKVISGALEKNEGSGFQAVTGGNVSVKYLSFTLFGAQEGDHWPPRITISMGITPSSTDAAVSSDVFNLQTTVSSRNIDCTSGVAGIAC